MAADTQTDVATRLFGLRNGFNLFIGDPFAPTIDPWRWPFDAFLLPLHIDFQLDTDR